MERNTDYCHNKFPKITGQQSSRTTLDVKQTDSGLITKLLIDNNHREYEQILYVPDEKIKKFFGHHEFAKIYSSGKFADISGINQGASGTCYIDAFLTSLTAMSEYYGQSLIKPLTLQDLKEMGVTAISSITQHYLVKFYDPNCKRVGIIIESTDFVKNGSVNTIHQHDHWARIIKKAFAVYRYHYCPTEPSKINEYAYSKYETQNVQNMVQVLSRKMIDDAKLVSDLSEVLKLSSQYNHELTPIALCKLKETCLRFIESMTNGLKHLDEPYGVIELLKLLGDSRDFFVYRMNLNIFIDELEKEGFDGNNLKIIKQVRLLIKSIYRGFDALLTLRIPPKDILNILRSGKTNQVYFVLTGMTSDCIDIQNLNGKNIEQTLLNAYLQGDVITISTSIKQLETLKGGKLIKAGGVAITESEYKGLVAPHAYAVLSVYYKTDENGNKKLMLKIRNPWGKTGGVIHSNGDIKRNNTSFHVRQRSVHFQLNDYKYDINSCNDYDPFFPLSDIKGYGEQSSSISEFTLDEVLKFFSSVTVSTMPNIHITKLCDNLTKFGYLLDRCNVANGSKSELGQYMENVLLNIDVKDVDLTKGVILKLIGMLHKKSCALGSFSKLAIGIKLTLEALITDLGDITKSQKTMSKQLNSLINNERFLLNDKLSSLKDETRKMFDKTLKNAKALLQFEHNLDYICKIKGSDTLTDVVKSINEYIKDKNNPPSSDVAKMYAIVECMCRSSENTEVLTKIYNVLSSTMLLRFVSNSPFDSEYANDDLFISPEDLGLLKALKSSLLPKLQEKIRINSGRKAIIK